LKDVPLQEVQLPWMLFQAHPLDFPDSWPACEAIFHASEAHATALAITISAVTLNIVIAKEIRSLQIPINANSRMACFHKEVGGNWLGAPTIVSVSLRHD
jgi:hypothetical protein